MRQIEINSPSSLGASSGTLKYGNFSETIFEFELPCPEIISLAPYTYKEQVLVTLNGETVIEGVVTSCKQQLTGDNYTWQISISDRWWCLANAIFLGPATDPARPELARVAYPRIREYDPGPYMIVRAATALTVVLDAAVAAGLILAYDINGVAPETEIPEFTAGGGYAEMLRKIKTARPNLVSYFDYSVAVPTLVIADQSVAELCTLDVTGNSLKQVSLNPRPDLVPPAVGIISISDKASTRMTSYPPEADLSQPGCVITQVQYPYVPYNDEEEQDPEPTGVGSDEYNFTRPRMIVTGRKLPVDAASSRAFWASKIPKLRDNPTVLERMQFSAGTTTPTPIETPDEAYDVLATEYELVSGAVGESSNLLKWCEVTYKQYVTIQGGDPPEEFRDIFTIRLGLKHWGGWLTWSGKTINKARWQYKIGTTVNDNDESIPEDEPQPEPAPDPVDPQYEQVCEDYYNATRTLPWEGKIIALDPPAFTALTGHCLNITGGRAEWQSMQTIIQTASYDIASGAITITTGAAEHLSLDDMLERSRALAELQHQSSTTDNTGQGDLRGGFGRGAGEIRYDTRAREHPPSPTVTPAGAVSTGAPPAPPDAGFALRAIYNEHGAVIGAICHKGYMQGPRNALLLPGTAEWLPASIGQNWLTVQIDDEGYISSAAIASAPGSEAEPKPIEYAKRGRSGEVYQAPPHEFPGEAGSYNILIGTVHEDGTIDQSLLGTAVIPVMGMSIIHEVYDTLPSESDPPSPDGKEAASIIAEQHIRYTKLCKIRGKDTESVSVNVAVEDGVVVISADCHCSCTDSPTDSPWAFQSLANLSIDPP